MKRESEIAQILEENRKRFEILQAKYNPLTGENSPCAEKRVRIKIEDFPIRVQYVPKSMTRSVMFKRIRACKTIEAFCRKYFADVEYTPELYDKVIKEFTELRSRHDFAFWAYTRVKIKPKWGGEMIPFKLNYPQIKLLMEMETDRLNNLPIRIIICKARQWGGSTLVQIYMSWIQLCHKTGWYSTIVAQTNTVSARILAMYTKMIERYPVWALGMDENDKPKLSQYSKGGKNDFAIKNKANESVRDIVIQIGSVQEPDNIRGGDVAMIHYSEVGVWKDTPGRRPEDLIRSLSGGLLMKPLTIEILESTPKGAGNYFHREYVRAKNGESNRKAFFIPWYCIVNDTMELSDKELEEMAAWLIHCREIGTDIPEGFADEGRYYWWLWEKGATLQGIAWYRLSRKGVEKHSDMASEAPSDDVEAFESTGSQVFDKYMVDELRKKCRNDYMKGEVVSSTGLDTGKECLNGLSFTRVDNANGHTGFLKMWKKPETDLKVRNRYLVIVDIGGRWKKADYSVITVIDRFMMSMGGKPEVVAEWRGHIDHDKLAWKATQIAKYYCNAFLVIESNTLETKDKERDTDGNDIEYILDIIAEVYYEHLYAREKPAEQIGGQMQKTKWGFHTNTSTKPKIIHHMIACVRDQAWVERCNEACDEMMFYEKKDDHSFGAVIGQKDDRVMTRAIGLWICYREMPMPVLVEERKFDRYSDDQKTEATI